MTWAPHPAPHGRGRYIYEVAGIAALAGLLFGYGTGVIAGALLFIDGDFGLSIFEKAAIVSAILAGATVGAGAAGPMADRYGRRFAISLAAVLFGIGSVISALAPDVAVLVVGRIIVGLGVGVASTAAPVYISEVAPADLRGALTTMFQLAVTAGFLLSFLVDLALAPDEAWRWMLAIAILPATLLGLAMLLVPHSPRWLAGKGRVDEAREALRRLRGDDAEADAELQEVMDSIQEPTSSWRELGTPLVRAALIVGVGLAVLQQVTGINAILYYAPTIFQDAGFGSNASAILATVGLGAVMVLATVVAVLMMDRIGRRTLLLFGSVGMAIGLAGMGLVFELPDLSESGKGTLAMSSLIVFLATFAVSFGPIVWVLNAEIYPLPVRGRAGGVAALVHWGVNFIVVLTFLPLFDAIGGAAVFWGYAALSLVAFVFVARLVPETRGKSLEQIEAYWRGRAKSADA